MSDKRASTQSKFSLLKFRKSKPGPEPAIESDRLTLTRTLTRTNTAASSVSNASTLVGTPVEGKKGKAHKYEVCEEDLLDWDDQAWGAPKSNLSWSGLFGRRKDSARVEE